MKKRRRASRVPQRTQSKEGFREFLRKSYTDKSPRPSPSV